MKSLGQVLIQYDWYPVKKREILTKTYTQRRTPCESTDTEGRWSHEGGSRDGSYAAIAKEYLELPEAGRTKERSSPTGFKEITALPTL